MCIAAKTLRALEPRLRLHLCLRLRLRLRLRLCLNLHLRLYMVVCEAAPSAGRAGTAWWWLIGLLRVKHVRHARNHDVMKTHSPRALVDVNVYCSYVGGTAWARCCTKGSRRAPTSQ